LDLHRGDDRGGHLPAGGGVMHAPQVSESWQVTTAVGVTVCTFGSEDHAMTWLRIRKSELPGAYVEKVTTTVTRQRVYTPRLRVAA
jgi:hypothetical protein